MAYAGHAVNVFCKKEMFVCAHMCSPHVCVCEMIYEVSADERVDHVCVCVCVCVFVVSDFALSCKPAHPLWFT